MTKRRDLHRERMEVCFFHLLLGYRPILQGIGYLLLIFSVIALLSSPLLSIISLGVAIFIVLLSISYTLTLYLAKLGAWLGTIRMNGS
jgi:hypothetical protein